MTSLDSRPGESGIPSTARGSSISLDGVWSKFVSQQASQHRPTRAGASAVAAGIAKRCRSVLRAAL